MIFLVFCYYNIKLYNIGEDVHKYFPDALDIVSSHVIPSIDRTKPPTVLKNFPIVDKNIIFMHGLGIEMIHFYLIRS